ncbi:anti-sigma regulatory factor [Acetobacterium woodii]|uniref:Positive regulator of sigma-B activit n=1 Tax=Acetobacterium woodii (strain ATCC 29683 / DSM 1030 / JCM 2381 / KCTC 1655 / WB1) TaxID=931626 RepID=H6LI03_ACEWD|nr:anti-sigma regulatory factor [Acetobacterium woodii]AFA48533.1 positive regulator of sigma-B activit [Acetobacterium woodii DSM 1030]
MKMNKHQFGDKMVKTVQIIETKQIELLLSHDNENVVYSVRRIANKAGFNLSDEVMIAAAASELSTNILRFAGKGQIEISIINDKTNQINGVEIFASDAGPGIIDIELALQENYSSLSNSLGLGLPSVKRIMDQFWIKSVVGEGTLVLARKWIKYETD